MQRVSFTEVIIAYYFINLAGLYQSHLSAQAQHNENVQMKFGLCFLKMPVAVWLGCEYRCLVVKPLRKQPLERPRRRWKGNIKRDLRKMEVGWNGLKIMFSDRF